MIFKYTLRLIKSTLNRFIAILAIVFIGVSFMMGLRSNYDIMQNSVEAYVDDSKLYDFQIYSNYGFDQNDVDALLKQPYIEDVYASKTRDVYLKTGSRSGSVTRVLELESNLNTIELVEGRMPEKENECLSIASVTTNIKLGSTFTIYLDNEEIEDSFKNSEFTVVGYAKSVENMTENLSISTLNKKELNNIIYIPNSNFISDYYTCLYISIDGARDVFSFSDEYKQLLDDKEEIIKNFSKYQSKELRNKIISEANEELEEARNELETNREKYQNELNQGKAELDNAKAILDSTRALIEEGEAKLPIAEQELKDGEKQIAENKKLIEDKEAELAEGIAKIESTGLSVDEINFLATRIYNQYIQTENEIAQLEAEKNEVSNLLSTYQAIIDASGCSSSIECRIKIQTIDPDSEGGLEQIEQLNQAIVAFDYVREHSDDISKINTNISLKQAALKAIDVIMQQQIGMNTKEGYAYVSDAVSKIKQGQAAIEQGKIELAAAEKRIEEGYVELEKGKEQLAEGKIEYEKGLAEYNKGLAKYEESLKTFEHEMQEAQGKIEDAEEQIANLSEAVWTVLKRYDTNYSFYMYANTCEQMKSIGTIIPLLFFVVAALVCSTTMTRLIDEQRGQIGIYRALGFTKKEINSIYLLYVVLASLAASVVAVVVGVFTFPTIIYKTWRLLYDLPPIKISMPIDDLLLCISCFTVLMMVVTYLVLNGTLKEVPAQLLRPKAPKSTKQIILEKWHWLWSKLPFTSKVTARNLLRYKARFIMTVIGIAGCTSLLLMGYGIKDSINGVIQLQYTEINRFNYQVNLKNDRHIDQVLDDIRSDENNEIIIPCVSYQSQLLIDDKDLNTTINIVSSSLAKEVYGLKYTNNKEANISDEGALITDKFARTNNISINDLISLESQSGVVKECKVVGIVKNYVGNCVYMSEAYYKMIFNEAIEYNVINVYNEKNANKLKLLQDKYNDVTSVSDFSASIKTFTDMFDALNLIIVVIIVVAGALAFVVLINLTNVNISERIREIATLKVLGFREHEVNSYIFKEVLLMSILGAIIGLPLGNIEEAYIMTVIDVDMCTFPHIVHTISYVYAFVITIIFTVIVLILTRKTLKNVEMVESLKSIE